MHSLLEISLFYSRKKGRKPPNINAYGIAIRKPLSDFVTEATVIR